MAACQGHLRLLARWSGVCVPSRPHLRRQAGLTARAAPSMRRWMCSASSPATGSRSATEPGTAATSSQPTAPPRRRRWTPRQAVFNLVGMPNAELVERCAELGMTPSHAVMIGKDIHRTGVTRVADLSVARRHRATLEDAGAVIDAGQIVTEQRSVDGTVKWLINVGPGLDVETVFIPTTSDYGSRGSMCVSSQAGCSLTCKFCHTGTQPLLRNLSSAQIAGQLVTARRALGCYPIDPSGDDLVSNIVFMGQGEPLYNFRNVSAACNVFTDTMMAHIAPKHVCISTSGIPAKMPNVGGDLGVMLALSLHATTDEVRSRIMPINNTYPISTVLEGCRRYLATGRRRKVMFEYIMLKGVNDSVEDAEQLVQLVGDMHCHINLIPFNPFPGSDFERSSEEDMDAFALHILSRGLSCARRQTRGSDILAACGQLNSKHAAEKLSVSTSMEL